MRTRPTTKTNTRKYLTIILYFGVIGLSTTNEQLAIAIQQGDTGKTVQLWENTCKLLYKLADEIYIKYENRFISSGVTAEDLKQECYFVFLDMVNAYKPEKEYKFTSYAGLQFKCRLRLLLGICNGKDIAPLNSARSFDEIITESKGENITLFDTLEDETAAQDFENSENRIYNGELARQLESFMTRWLNDTQFKVITYKRINKLTHKQISQKTGLTVSQIIAADTKGMQKLKNHKNELTDFVDCYIDTNAYKFTGYSSFKERWASSQELISERLERIERKTIAFK